MYTKLAAAAVVTISLLSGGSTYAQDRGYGDRGSNDNYRRNDRGAYDNNFRRGNEMLQQDRGRGHADFGYGGHEWRQGGRLPAEYRTRHYVVHDWHGHHLSAPPRGYHWVQHGNDYVLAAITTGVIAQILLNHQ